MKSFLRKTLLWGGAFLLLKGHDSIAQPIQLIPQKKVDTPSPLAHPFDQEAGAFWAGTPPSVVETYFPKIPLHLTSPSLRSLRSQILDEDYTPLLQSPAYEETRFSLLEGSGKLDKAQELFLDASFPNKEALLLDLQWLEGRSGKACEKISNLIRTSPSLEWKKQNIYCLYLNGEEERGKIALELLSEANADNLPLFKALFGLSSPPPFESAFAQSPFLLTVWGATGQEIPVDALKTLAPSTLALIATLEKIPLETRIQAAEQAFQEGAMSTEGIVKLAKEAPPETLLGKLNAAFGAPKTVELLLLLENASKEHKLGLIAGVFEAALMALEPSLETLPLAPYLIRAFLENNQKERAQKWSQFYMREAPDEAIGLLPLLHLAFPHIKWGAPQLQAWQSYQMRINPAQAPQHSYALRHIFEALDIPPGVAVAGEPLPPSWRQEKTLFEGDSLELLEAALKSGRKGEVLLLILALIGNTPLEELSPDKFIRLLSVLHRSGETTEARSLALEYLLAVVIRN